MKLLLDTHIWLWSLVDRERLSQRVAEELEDPKNELWLSPVSIWELLRLCQKKRVVLNEDVDLWVKRALRKMPLKEAPITEEVALQTTLLLFPYRDATDFFLVATAKVFELTLVTADEHLLKSREISALANR